MSTNPIAVDSDETSDESAAMTVPASPRYVRLARYVSNILAPVSISIPFILLVAVYHASNILAALGYGLLTLLFLSIGPLIYILIGVHLGKLSDVDVSRRSERAGPFLFGIGSTVAGLLLLMAIHGPKNLQSVLIITSISGVIMMLTTLWWKISIHASSLAGAATILTILYGVVMAPTFLLVILVSWSRVVLHRHTVAQVVAGSLVSIALASLLASILGV